MQPISHVVRISVPNYLANLPVPDSFTGWFKLGFTDWARLVPFFAAVGGLSYSVYRVFVPSAHLNKKIRKNEPKVADVIPIENLGDVTALCRCWKSQNWPYCDGSHGPHNAATGDNVGPAVIKRNN